MQPARHLSAPIVVDAHTHVFEPEVCSGRHVYVPRDRWFGHLYQDPRAVLVPVEELIASMDAAGIDHSIVCGFPWADPGLCRAHNDYLNASAGAFPTRISWLATVVPGDTSAANEAARCFDLGAVGVGELNADAQGFDFREPRELAALAEACQGRDLPILFHVSEPVGHEYPGKGTATPEKFVRFLAAFPDLRVVAAHWGGGLPFYELMPEVAALARNVVYDSAASTYLYRFEVFRAVLDTVGAERVMMASDYPVLRQKRFLRRVRASGLRPEETGPVLGGNARRVFRLAKGRPADD
ncbi:MAG TPA: amidohydrolase family protein [Thermomicrobiaceae bacterium]|nr:amidohydrolase family protein [Thermomicrobiaceae bacterium]